MFTHGRFREAWQRWATGQDITMNVDMFRELTSYATSLLVLQRVEMQHHLIHFKTSHGPAIHPATVSAHLRRFQNKDLEQISFRAELEDLCSNLGNLVSEEWSTRRDLFRLVSGYTRSIMFPDIKDEEACLKNFDKLHRVREHPLEAKLQIQHCATILEENSFYCLPTGNGSDQEFVIFQLLQLNPGWKRYVQKVAKVGVDATTLICERWA